MRKAEIIAIGDELLIGQVINTNASWIGNLLTENGFEVCKQISISDKKEEIVKTLKQAQKDADIIILTGGLGPTKDDITKATLCEYFDSKLILNQDALDNIYRIFNARNYKITPLNRKQAEIPDKCICLPNIYGTAPGMLFKTKGKIIISLPGVPMEMKHLMKEEVLPILKENFERGCILRKTIMTHGIGESFLADKINDWEENLPKELSLAYLPQPGIVRLRITAKGEDKENLNFLLSKSINELFPLIKDYFFGFDDQKIEDILFQKLKENNIKISVAESCTGGYISNLITLIPGASEVYNGGITTYSNQAKINLLDVPEKHIIEFGAVSKEVAIAMAKNCRIKFNSDIAISTTGIAGPDGGTKEKPVGTVWIGISCQEKTEAFLFTFGEIRETNIRKTALKALDLALKKIKNSSNSI
ncbi:MAG: competence/damage-inducible protein A [Bacteroidales bacterium]